MPSFVTRANGSRNGSAAASISTQPITEAIGRARAAAAKEREDRDHHGPGSWHKGLLIGATIAAPASWMGLAWAVVQWRDEHVTVVHAVWIGFATVLAAVWAVIAASYVSRRQSASQHDELLLGFDAVADRTMDSSQAVAGVVEHLANAIPNAKVHSLR
ncbi:hypothetical protein [Micromonospora maritima]|uniref:hypothetical protein n=1 Tax=Micromonospora maritima TaxID=986711 RepID=UPI00157D2423|nr:hypothetical protein [Micromonospora maritima]